MSRRIKRLRKQPRRRPRTEAQTPAPAARGKARQPARPRQTAAPQPTMPQSVSDRRWRTRTEPIRITAATIRAAIFSSRMVSLLLLGLCVGVLVLSWFQPGLYLHQFDVRGLSYVAAQDVIAASELEGMHIFAAEPTDAIVAVQQVPGVVAADIVVTWPNRTVITVEEERPVAIWEQDGQSFWLNASGHLVELRDSSLDLVRIVVDAASGNNMPLTIPDELDGEIDPLQQETRMIPPGIMESALQLAALNPDFYSLFYSASHGLSYQHTDGWFAYFGSSGDMMVKASIYQSLLNQLTADETPIYYMDLSDEHTVYYRAVDDVEEGDAVAPELPVQQIPVTEPVPVPDQSLPDSGAAQQPTGTLETGEPVQAAPPVPDAINPESYPVPVEPPPADTNEADGVIPAESNNEQQQFEDAPPAAAPESVPEETNG